MSITFERESNTHALIHKSRRAVWATNSCIQSWGDKLDDWQLGLLQQVLSYSETCEEPATSRVHQAAKQGHGMAEALQEDGWARDVLDSSGWASLHWAAFGGHVEAVQQLIDAGADVDVEDGDGWTPLMCAAIQSHPDCAHQLLNAGCCMDHTDMDGRTVLHVAAAYGLVDMVRMLLTADDARISRASASGSARRSAKGMAMAAAASWDGQLPLHHLAFSTEKDATAEAIEETARLLLDAHPDAIEARDEFGQTPARFAVVLDNLPLLRFLIRAGASLTTIDTSHYNLLHFIAAYASAPAIKLLLERGWAENQMPMIDHHVVNRWGRKSWDLFVHSMHESPWEVAPFRHAGAKVRFAFADLYCRIRDKNLRYDISVLKDALTALHGGHINAAQDQLCALARHKADCHNDDASAFYRGVGKQIDAGEIEAATVVIEEDLQHLDDELQSSPWDQESYFDYLASKSQWFEVSDTCFWIEPAAVFLSRGLHQEPNIEEQQNEPQSSHAQDETEAAQPDRYLDFNLITEIYSEEGQLLYDRETALCSPREFLDQFEPDFHDCKTQDDSESDASNAE